MKYIIKDSYKDMSEYAANEMVNLLLDADRNMYFVVASGNTSTLTYQFFCEQCVLKKINLKRIHFILLDEWQGLPWGHPDSCYTYIKDNLIQPLKLSSSQYIYFDSSADYKKNIKRLKKEIHDIDIDMSVLGIGINGHIGFNEPSDYVTWDIHYTHLSKESMSHPMVKGNEFMVSGGITLGIRDLFRSKHILLLANGKSKQSIIKKLKNSYMSSQLPVSYMLLHPHAQCVCDAEAGVFNCKNI